MDSWLGIRFPTQAPPAEQAPFIYGVHSLKESHTRDGGGCVPIGGEGVGCAGVAKLRTDGTILTCSFSVDRQD